MKAHVYKYTKYSDPHINRYINSWVEVELVWVLSNSEEREIVFLEILGTEIGEVTYRKDRLTNETAGDYVVVFDDIDDELKTEIMIWRMK